jgi:DNA-binding transcriptional ArsR family regulator
MSEKGSQDRVFSALAHPARRRIIDLLVQVPGCSVKWIASNFEFSRIAAMKHLTVLEEAGLVLSEKHGRTRKLFFNPIPIQQIYDRWTTDFSSFWAGRVADIQSRVEARAAKRDKRHA